MKKTYIAPEVEITEIETQTLMLGLSKEGGIEESLVNEHDGDRRGTWGRVSLQAPCWGAHQPTPCVRPLMSEI